MKTAKRLADAPAPVPLRVLIVEDSEDDARLVLRELRRGGYEPFHERVDTPEAMRRALAQQEAWDVVLSDWRMPRFEAPEALEMLRGAGSEAPFIIVSGRVGEDAAVEAVKAGAHDYVMKDDLARLCATVGRGLEEAEARRERERAEKSLKESEQRFRSLVMNSSDMITVFAPDGTRLYASPSIERVLGYKPEKMIGGNAFDLVHPDDAQRVREEFADRAWTPGTGQPFEFRSRHADGSWHTLEAIGTNLTGDPSVGGIVFNARDITERKRAEAALRRRDAILRAVAFAAECFLKRAASWEESIEEVLERLGRAAEASRVYVFENYTGKGGEELTSQRYEWVAQGISAQIGDPSLKAFPYRAAGFDRWMETLGRGSLVYGHTRTFPKAERQVLRAQDIESIMAVPVFVEGEWWGFIGFDECEREREWSAAEIEALKAAADTLGAAIQRDRAGLTLRESEERYRAVVEHATEGIFLCDAATGNILESNAAFRKLLGYNAAELQSMKIYDLIAHDREGIDSNTRLILEEGSRYLGERQYRRKDGSLVDIEAAASAISYGGRQVICDVIRDVTERKKAHRMLHQRARALAGIAASLTVNRPVQSTLDALAAGAVQSTEAVACSVVLIDEQTSMIHTAGSHGLPEGYTAAMQASWRAGVHGRMVRVFRSQQPYLAHDVRRVLLDNPLYAPIHPLVREVRWDTVYIVPLVARGESLGAINLYYLPGREPTEDERVFLGAVADQIAIAVENARLFAAAQEKAALEERQHLARELHDSVSQALYGIALGARTASAWLDREGPRERVAEWLDYVLSLADAGLTEMRALIFELRPESLKTEGLIAALEKQAAALQARHEIPVRATLDREPELPLEAKEALYRIAQEALHNTVKHARASRAELRLERDAQGTTLEVSDDGVGFDQEASFPGHLGLKSMRERAARGGYEYPRADPAGYLTTSYRGTAPAMMTVAEGPEASSASEWRQRLHPSHHSPAGYSKQRDCNAAGLSVRSCTVEPISGDSKVERA